LSQRARFDLGAPDCGTTGQQMFIVTYALLVGLVGVALVYLGARP